MSEVQNEEIIPVKIIPMGPPGPNLGGDAFTDPVRSAPVPTAAHHAPSNDPALLLVKGKFGENKIYIKSLAHAIVTVVTRYGYASLKCVGASSVNNAVKAFTIASGNAKTRGVNLVAECGFQNADFDGVEKTAIVFKVFDR
jgi:stage V sporulation protein SpoVS